jgi:hypothetical protein
MVVSLLFQWNIIFAVFTRDLIFSRRWISWLQPSWIGHLVVWREVTNTLKSHIRIHLQFSPEDGGSMFLRNVDNLSQNASRHTPEDSSLNELAFGPKKNCNGMGNTAGWGASSVVCDCSWYWGSERTKKLQTTQNTDLHMWKWFWILS